MGKVLQRSMPKQRMGSAESPTKIAGMKKPSRKSVAWYQAELRSVQHIAEDALNDETGERYGTSLVAIMALAEAAADGCEMYLEATDAGS